MNKLLALFLLSGAIGGFGLAAMRTVYQEQNQSPRGSPTGPVRTVYVRESERSLYFAFGFACLLGPAFSSCKNGKAFASYFDQVMASGAK